MGKTIQITNQVNPSTPWIWTWNEQGQLVMPPGGDITTSEGISVLSAQTKPEWNKYVLSIISGYWTLNGSPFVVADPNNQQMISIFDLPPGGFLEHALIATNTKFLCNVADSITCGLGMASDSEYFIPCEHELMSDNVTQHSSNLRTGASTLNGGKVFVLIDVLGSVVSNIESGSLTVYARWSQLPR